MSAALPAVSLPAPVLAIGITGHRSLAAADPGIVAGVARALGLALDLVRAAGDRAVAADGRGGEATYRLVTMLAEGADLIAAGEAAIRSIPVCAILPGAAAAYRATFEHPGSATAFDAALAAAERVYELPLATIDDPAFGQANALILAQSDLLVAVWDGRPARGPAGTAEVVQAAIEQRIPTIVVRPEADAFPEIIADAEPLGLARRAAELERSPAAPALRRTVAAILRQPQRRSQRRALGAYLSERPSLTAFRTGHRLLNLLGGSWKDRRLAPRPLAAGPHPALQADDAAHIARIGLEFDRADALANHYGELMRSTLVLRFLVIAFAALVNAAVALSLPWLNPLSALAQVLVTLFPPLGEQSRARHRWHERWLDYRTLAERLRCLRYLQPLGLSDEVHGSIASGQVPRWADWYLTRLARELGPPAGGLTQAEIAERFAWIRDAMAEQLAYHKRTLKRLARLDMRLRWIAGVTVFATLVAGAASMVPLLAASNSAYAPPLLLTFATAAASVMTLAATLAESFNGLRSAADFVRLARRSVATSVSLGRLRRGLDRLPTQYDRLVAAARLTTRAMIREVAEWRLVVESRRPTRLRLARVARKRGRS